MQNQLVVVFPRRLQLQQHDQALLCPVRSLQEIVRLEARFMRTVWEALVHAWDVEVPHWRAAHDPKSKGSENRKVDCCIELLHESILFAPLLDSAAYRNGSDHRLHQKFPGEGEHHSIECHEREILWSLAILCRIAQPCW